MSGKCLGHGFGGDCPKWNRLDEFRKAIRDDQQVLILTWDHDRLAKNVNGYKLQRSEGRKNFHRFLLSAEAYPVSGACYAVFTVA